MLVRRANPRLAFAFQGCSVCGLGAQVGQLVADEDVAENAEKKRLHRRLSRLFDREPEHQAWKQQVLAGDIELEEIDTTPYSVRRR